MLKKGLSIALLVFVLALANNVSSQDSCVNAEAVTCGSSVSATTLGATSGVEALAPNCGPSIDGPGVWFTIEGDGVNEITATTCGSTYDSRLHVFSGSCGAFICEGANDDSDCNGDSGNELQSTITWFGAAGVDYFIHVSGWNGSLGDFDISFTCSVPTCGSQIDNDQCNNAFSLTDGTLYEGTNVCAYANDNQPNCDPFATINGVWYMWNSGANNAATIDFSAAAEPAIAAAIEPGVAMYAGNCSNLTELYCEDNMLPIVGEEVTGLTIETNYYFLVWTDSDAKEGEFDLVVTGGTSGCTIPGACNYESAATIDDDSCDLSCIGCTDSDALNYSPTATSDDGTCVVPQCSEPSTPFSYCYGNNEETTFVFIEDNPGQGVYLEFLQGAVENGFDTFEVFDGADTSAPSLTGGPIDGDISGLVFGSTGASLTLEILSDASNSCESGGSSIIEANVYCGFLEICGCTDPLSPDYNPDATIDCGCNYFGCTNPAACNYVPGALQDDGSCCLDNCTTIEITDTFGDGSGSFALFDDMSNLLASGSLDDGNEISFEFCLPDGCLTLVVTEDAFPDEMGLTITTQDGLIYEEVIGNGINSDPITLDFGSTGECVIPSCQFEEALNYNPNSSYDCLGVLGGTDTSCCSIAVANNCCYAAIPIESGVEVNWDTNQANGSGFECSPTLVADVWYTFTPSCDMEVTIASTSPQGGELAVWEGDCEGDALSLVQCAPNSGFTAVTAEVLLQEGITYYIQTGSNSIFAANSTGIIVLTEGECRGCVYDFALNYDPTAVIDDGSCIEAGTSCPGDFNDDGLITSSDLTGFLSVYGGLCL